MSSLPEDLAGQIPARTELTVLPADPPRPPLNFSVREYMGMHLEDAAGNLLGQDQDLQAGAEVYCNGVKLTLTSPSQAKSASSDWLYFIQRGGDDRNCWVCNGVANLRAVTKLELTK